MIIKVFGKQLLEIASSRKSFNEYYRQLISPLLDGESGSSISENNAYEKHVWMFACTNAIARNCARTRLRFYKKNGEEVTDTRISDLFYKGSTDYFHLIEALYNFLLNNGNTFWKLDNEIGILTGIELLNSDYVSPIFQYGKLVGYKYFDGTPGINYSLDQIVHFKTFNPSCLYWGLSVAKIILQTLINNKKARKFNGKLLDGVSPGIFFVAPEGVSDPAFKRLQEDLDKRSTGIDKAGRPMLLEGGIDVKDFKLTQKDLAWAEMMKIDRDEIIAAFNIPPSELGIYERVNYSNAETQIKNFWYKVLIPMLEYGASVIDSAILQPYFPGVTCKFDTSMIQEIQEDEGKKLDLALKLSQLGYPTNAINKKLNLGLEEYPWLDHAYRTVSLVAYDEDQTDVQDQLRDQTQDAKNKFERLEKALAALPEKSFEVSRKEAIWKKFDTEIRPLEAQYERKLQKFFYSIRKKLLKKLNEKGFTPHRKDILDWESEKDRLGTMSDPFFLQAVLIGGNGALSDMAIHDIVFNVENQEAIDYLLKKKLLIKNIVDTVEKQVKKRINDGITAGNTTAEIADSIKDLFNSIDSRARSIAQTEILGAANNGRMFALQEAGITKKEWINSHDDRVRETHQISEIVPLNEKFANGLTCPHDPNGPPEEVINCRCTVGGVV